MRYPAYVLAIALLTGCAGTAMPAAPSTTLAEQSSARPAQDDAKSTVPAIVFYARSSGPAVPADVYGANMATWYDWLQPWVNPSLAHAGMHLIRFPGGSESDAYHWENGGTLCANQGSIDPHSTFDNLMTKVAAPNHLDVAITLNYGSNQACNGGGDPNEAAAWVAYAKSKGYNVPFWTLGNEDYGSWEYDLHANKNDPTTYASEFKTGFYPAVKAANPQVKLGVVADFAMGSSTAVWNDVVFRQAGAFDFVEAHYYPEYLHDNDSYLLGAAIDTFVADLSALRGEMTADGVSTSVPIYLGEFNNDAGVEGKQSVSIVNGLYLGQMLGVAIEAGIPMATWWLAYGSCDHGGDYSKSLYGWQTFGSEGLFSDNLPDTYQCTNAPRIPGGTPYPTGRVMGLFAQKVPPGSRVRKVTVARTLGTSIRAFGFAVNGGYALALFNNTLETRTVDAKILNSAKSTLGATLSTYGKAQYDQSKYNRWTGPVTKRLGPIRMSAIPLSLPPYSLTILSLQ